MNRMQFWCGLGAGILLSLAVMQSGPTRSATADEKPTKGKRAEEKAAVEKPAAEKSPAAGSAEEPLLYELRTYYSPAGKLDELNARFRNHTMALFEKHGMKNIMYWTPVDKPDTLIYVIAHKNKAAAEASWAAFRSDPVWLKVAEETQRNGKIVEKVESVYMLATDYSPMK